MNLLGPVVDESSKLDEQRQDYESRILQVGLKENIFVWLINQIEISE